MGRPIKKPATYQDLLRVPEPLVAEIVDGELYASPRPSPPHAVATTALGGDLSGPFQRGRGGPGGWWILFEPELHLGGDVLVPDLAGWRRERMPAVPKTAAFELAPDWICEVLSPGTARLDRGRKLPAYAREGVGHAWLVDPTSRTVEVLGLDQGGWRLLTTCGDDDLVRLPPFDAVELDLLALWGETRPAP
ncbi:MAG TPA: Uma2 family endonuclease [Polyangia bacterium]|jgi:Uma2 family endonuclease|nr:Uma2 family endonuclease [Polyangia bacterium]